MKNIYNQIVDFIRSIPNIWYVTLIIGLLVVSLLMFIKFYKSHDVVEKKAGKITYIIIALIFIAILIFIVSVRK